MKYIKGLDTIRALAVTFVLVWHYLPKHKLYTLTGNLSQFLLPSGVFGVILFFVLSGYLITNILLRAKQENNKKLQIIKNFVIRRALRIFPIYYFLLIVLVVIGWQFTEGEQPYLFTYTSNIFVFKNMSWSSLGHTWSLSVEEQFYLIWPWLIIFIGKKHLKFVFISFILVAIISSYIIVLKYGSTFASPAFSLTTCCFDSFGIGGFYAYFSKHSKNKFVVGNILNKAFFIAIVISIFWKLCPYIGIEAPLFFLFRTVDSIIAIGIIHLAISNQSPFLKQYFFENKLFNIIGKVSYGMYLFHYPLGRFFRKSISYLSSHYSQSQFIFLLHHIYLLFVIKFIIVFSISYLSFNLFEKKVLLLKTEFEYGKS